MAIEFTQHFYGILFEGQPIEHAFDQAERLTKGNLLVSFSFLYVSFVTFCFFQLCFFPLSRLTLYRHAFLPI